MIKKRCNSWSGVKEESNIMYLSRCFINITAWFFIMELRTGLSLLPIWSPLSRAQFLSVRAPCSQYEWLLSLTNKISTVVFKILPGRRCKQEECSEGEVHACKCTIAAYPAQYAYGCQINSKIAFKWKCCSHSVREQIEFSSVLQLQSESL